MKIAIVIPKKYFADALKQELEKGEEKEDSFVCVHSMTAMKGHKFKYVIGGFWNNTFGKENDRYRKIYIKARKRAM